MGLILSCDQLTKQWVDMYLIPQAGIPIISTVFSLTYIRNTGFAFGLLQKAPDFLQGIIYIGVPVFALILIVLIFIKLQDDKILTSIALTTILGGAIGNLIDRLQHGYVIDFLSVHWKNGSRLPTFNIADCSILVGVLIMFINTLYHGKVSRGV